jgi:hypothetical protein
MLQTPLQKVDSIFTATLEKILVDLFCEDVLFLFYQGSELGNIYNEAFSTYSINEKSMLRYANRRKRKAKLIPFLRDIDLLTI